MGKVNLFRYILLGILLAIGLASIGLAASPLAAFSDIDFIPVLLPLDLAAGVLTLVVILPSIIIDFFRKGAFTSMVAVEIGWSFFLMIIWVAAAGVTTAQLELLPKNCNYIKLDNFGRPIPDPQSSSFCRQLQALNAMTWLAFIGFFAWVITLITLAAIAHSRGNRAVWKKSVTGTNFTERLARRPKFSKTDYQDYPSGRLLAYQQPMGYSQHGYPPAAPPMQQPTGYPPYGQYPGENRVPPHPQGYHTSPHTVGHNVSPPPANMYSNRGVAQV